MEWRPQAEPVRRRPSQARAQQPRPEPPVTQPAQGIAQSNQGLRGATGPDFKDAEVRAAVGYMAGIFKVPMLDPDSPDIWVENVRDALDASGMGAIFVAADWTSPEG